MNYAGFTRPVWSWLTSADNRLTFLGIPVGVPVRRRDRHHHAGFRRAVAVESGEPALESARLARHPRIRTVTADRELVRSGVALQMTYLGAPMIFSGEELGFEGRDGEDSRRPIPWHRRAEWDTETLGTFRDLFRIRHTHPALRRARGCAG